MIAASPRLIVGSWCDRAAYHASASRLSASGSNAQVSSARQIGPLVVGAAPIEAVGKRRGGGSGVGLRQSDEAVEVVSRREQGSRPGSG